MMFGGGPFGMPMGAQRPFEETFKCHSMTMHNKEDKENGDKIILPASAFETLARMTITYPMQFELVNEYGAAGMGSSSGFMDLTKDSSSSSSSSSSDSNKISNGTPKQLRTHVGVLEFTAPEGKCFVPYWIMQNLLVGEGGFLKVKNVTLPLCTFIKFRPQNIDFLEISNPKAVLESTLRNFSCVTKHDQICLPYNGRKYYLDVVDVQPKEACSIVEADVKVDFEAPPGYNEKIEKEKAEKAAAEAAAAAAAAAAAVPEKGSEPAPAPGSADGVGTLDGLPKMNEETIKANEARKAQLDTKQAGYVAFSGKGRRVDSKKKGEEENSTKKEVEEAPTTAVRTARKGKWKTKKQGSSFHGQARSLQ